MRDLAATLIGLGVFALFIGGIYLLAVAPLVWTLMALAVLAAPLVLCVAHGLGMAILGD